MKTDGAGLKIVVAVYLHILPAALSSLLLAKHLSIGLFSVMSPASMINTGVLVSLAAMTIYVLVRLLLLSDLAYQVKDFGVVLESLQGVASGFMAFLLLSVTGFPPLQRLELSSALFCSVLTVVFVYLYGVLITGAIKIKNLSLWPQFKSDSD